MSGTEWRFGQEPESEPFHYTGCGLDDVYLRSGFDRVTTDYGAGVVIKNLDGLHCAIARHLAYHKKALNGKEFRFLRKQMKLSQEELSDLLSVSDQSIARWEKGETDIPGPAELAIRAIFAGHDIGAINVVELSKSINAIADETRPRQVFEETDEGWKAAA